MKKGKSFQAAAEQFISKPAAGPDPAQDGTEKDELQEIRDKAAEHGMIVKEQSKTARIQLLTRPIIRDELKKAAKKQKISTNELINQILSEYLRKEGRL